MDHASGTSRRAPRRSGAWSGRRGPRSRAAGARSRPRGEGRGQRGPARRRRRPRDPARGGWLMTAIARASLRIRLPRWGVALLVVLCWLIGYAAFHGRDTMALAQADLTPLHDRLNSMNDVVGARSEERRVGKECRSRW